MVEVWCWESERAEDEALDVRASPSLKGDGRELVMGSERRRIESGWFVCRDWSWFSVSRASCRRSAEGIVVVVVVVAIVTDGLDAYSLQVL